MTDFTNSKAISEVFDKPHRQIISTIKGMIKMEPSLDAHFKKSFYGSPQGKILSCYDCSKLGADLVIFGMKGKKAVQWKIQYINKFKHMQAEL